MFSWWQTKAVGPGLDKATRDVQIVVWCDCLDTKDARVEEERLSMSFQFVKNISRPRCRGAERPPLPCGVSSVQASIRPGRRHCFLILHRLRLVRPVAYPIRTKRQDTRFRNHIEDNECEIVIQRRSV